MADDKDRPQITQSSNSNEPPLVVPPASNFEADASDALSKLAASAAAGQSAYDAVQDAKRKASGISRAPAPPPSLLGNNYQQKPPEPSASRDESLRGDLERAHAQHNPSANETELAKPKEASGGHHSAASDSTWTGRYLDYLGLAFILVPPEPVVAALMKGEAIHLEVALPLLIGAWAVGGALLFAGLTWPKWKPKNEAIAATVSAAAHNIWVWVAVLLSIAFGPTILYSSLSRPTAVQSPACWDGKAPPCNDQPAKPAPKPIAGPFFHEAIPHAPPKLGPLSTLRMVDSIASKGNSLSPSDFINQRWALIITFPKENDEISMIVRRIIGAKLSTVPLPPPNANDLDAPKLIESGSPGIILHGNNQLNDRLFYELGSCFTVKKTARTADNLQDWATGKIPEGTRATWIEIGPGSPWKEPFPCSE